MDTWRGHFPITSFVRQALLNKAAVAGAAFSPAERTLFVACEFWAATATRELARHLGSQAEERLRAAHRAFSQIGAVRVASALQVMIGSCPSGPSPLWLNVHVGALELQLLDTEDEVDGLIARYALANMSSDYSATTGDGPKAVPCPLDRDG